MRICELAIQDIKYKAYFICIIKSDRVSKSPRALVKLKKLIDLDLNLN